MAMYDEADLAQDELITEQLCSSFGNDSAECNQAKYSQSLGIQIFQNSHQSTLPILDIIAIAVLVAYLSKKLRGRLAAKKLRSAQ